MMNKIFSNKSYPSTSIFFLTLLFLTACGLSEKKETYSFDLSKVERMAFRFETDSNPLKANLPKATIGKQISDNLSQWGYQFSTAAEPQHDHLLTIHLGAISLGSTPVGFSFTAGNSDPRSLAFQQATTIPLTCALMPKESTQQRAELILEIMADDYLGTDMVSVSKDEMIERLINDISTTCFNLLSSLNIKTIQKQSSAQTISPSWIPEIRIEVENVPEHADSANTSSEPSSKPTTSSGDSSSQPDKKIETPNPVKVIPDAPRKRFIIHNQGSPIIFKFGHDRQ